MFVTWTRAMDINEKWLDSRYIVKVEPERFGVKGK